ncbi:AAA family ATPase [Micromonospora echinospora]|uniref:AAA family ATPase n=1 Tax=Micromonospora echinospora TaxID=1877 RepID=UPI0033D6B734
MTDDHRSEAVDRLIYGHLDRAGLPEAAQDLIVAALCGEQDLAALLGGAAPPPRPVPSTSDDVSPGPVGTYLDSIEVTGFRGIGPTATLKLVPGPGLTIVTGRNGSGKSSFAEAAEFALTGENKRWAGRSTIWKKGWRNLHSGDEPAIRVRLGLTGQRDGATVECHWPDDAGLADHDRFLQAARGPRRPVADLGWGRGLELYRPFLSYAELGGLVGSPPSELHDSLHRILGLDRLVHVEAMLKAARREADQRRKLGDERRPVLLAALAGHPDPRARRAERALVGRHADLDALDALATGGERDDDATVEPLRQLDALRLPDRVAVAAEVDRLRAGLRQIAELAGTPAEEARAVAGLLRDALRHHDSHPDQPCPVCGGRTLDEAWAEQARTTMDQLTARAEQLDAAHRAEREARRALRRLVPVRPLVLGESSLALVAEQVDHAEAALAWRRWDDLLAAADSASVGASALAAFDALASALAPVRAAARAALDRRRQAWQPVADEIRAWTGTERASRQAAVLYPALKRAVTEFQAIAAKIRADRLAPIAAEATRIWNDLRQDSNVDLGAVKLAGNGTARRVDLDVTVDGVAGAALSVMSQGELHSLALALFLPRATMPESPFRFLVIDDPVQSMDPSKVYGLAKVLAEVARHRHCRRLHPRRPAARRRPAPAHRCPDPHREPPRPVPRDGRRHPGR